MVECANERRKAVMRRVVVEQALTHIRITKSWSGLPVVELPGLFCYQNLNVMPV